MRTVLFLQIAGWCVLLFYFMQTPITFDPWWILAYIAIFVVVTFAYVVVLKPLIARVGGVGKVVAEKDGVNTLVPDPKNAPVAEQILRRPYMVLLAPGEDGIFFVPVALSGVTWWAALLASILFGLAHYRTYSTSQCAVKSVCSFLCCLFVLPHGVLNFVIGHFLLDTFAIGGFVLSAWKDGLLTSDVSANLRPQPTPTSGATEPER